SFGKLMPSDWDYVYSELCESFCRRRNGIASVSAIAERGRSTVQSAAIAAAPTANSPPQDGVSASCEQLRIMSTSIRTPSYGLGPSGRPGPHIVFANDPQPPAANAAMLVITTANTRQPAMEPSFCAQSTPTKQGVKSI